MSQVLQGKRALEGELWPEVDDDDDDEEDNMAQSERDRTYIFMQAITAAGIPLNAQQDALSRLERAFAGREFDAIDAHTAVGELRTTAKHLWMGGAPPPPPPPGPAPAPALTIREQRKQQQKYMPTEAQLKSIEGKRPEDRLTALREWEAQAQETRR